MADVLSPDSLSNNIKLWSDTVTTVTAADTITTSLRKVNRVQVSFEDDPGDANLVVSAVPVGASNPKAFTLKTWKTDGSDPTPAAATAFGKKVVCTAFGY